MCGRAIPLLLLHVARRKPKIEAQGSNTGEQSKFIWCEVSHDKSAPGGSCPLLLHGAQITVDKPPPPFYKTEKCVFQGIKTGPKVEPTRPEKSMHTKLPELHFFEKKTGFWRFPEPVAFPRPTVWPSPYMQVFRETGPPACRIGHHLRRHQTTVLRMPLIGHRGISLDGEILLITGGGERRAVMPQGPSVGLGITLLPLRPWPRAWPRQGGSSRQVPE